jgi:hypothetical protein
VFEALSALQMGCDHRSGADSFGGMFDCVGTNGRYAGSTVASSLFSQLDSNACEIVVLDEAGTTYIQYGNSRVEVH